MASVVSAKEIRVVAELLQISPEGLQKSITFKVTVRLWAARNDGGLKAHLVKRHQMEIIFIYEAKIFIVIVEIASIKKCNIHISSLALLETYTGETEASGYSPGIAIILATQKRLRAWSRAPQ